MGALSWFKGKRKIPPGTTETEIRYGRARDSTLWPKKGKLYTRPGELHVPLVVRTKDEKLRVGDCVIRYRVINSAALLPYLDENGELQKEKLERDLAYEARGEVSPKLADYTSEELLNQCLENKAFVQKQLSDTLTNHGMNVQKMFTVWDDPRLSKDIWNEEVEKFYRSEVDRALLRTKKKRKKIKKPCRAKRRKRKRDHKREYKIKIEVRPGKCLKEMNDRELRSMARKQARDYVHANPRYGSVGEAAFWVNSFEQVFYRALREGGYGTD